MKRIARYPISSKSYRPSPAVGSLLNEMLQLEIKSKTGKSAGGGSKLTKEDLDRERKRLNRRKVEVLNKHIFPAMANLTVFLEYMNDSPYIQSTFERDLKGLFFAKSVSNKNKKDETVFGRFIKACGISTKDKLWKEDGSDRLVPIPVQEGGGLEPVQEFRFILWEEMMRRIWDKLPAAGEFKLKDNAFLNNILYADFGRAFSCISLLAQEAREHLEFDEDRRPALF